MTVAATCTTCGVAITGLGKSGLCASCWRHNELHGSVTSCRMCKGTIEVEEGRYQYVYVARGGRQGRAKTRKVIATICEQCWRGKKAVV